MRKTQDLVPDGWTLRVRPWPSDTENRFSRGFNAAIFFEEREDFMEFEVIYKYDDAGYLIGATHHQVMEGVGLPPNATKVALPEGADLETNFYKWDGAAWQAEKKPTSAEELVGIVVSHKSQTPHDQEMRALVQKYGTADGYRIKRGDDLEWIVEKIPQEELDAQAIDAELADFDRQVASLKDRMATAMLMDDTETATALKAQFKSLTGV